MYTSSELAYADLTESQGDNDGQAIDVHNPNLFVQNWGHRDLQAVTGTEGVSGCHLKDD